jgi:hypothetical protein
VIDGYTTLEQSQMMQELGAPQGRIRMHYHPTAGQYSEVICYEGYCWRTGRPVTTYTILEALDWCETQGFLWEAPLSLLTPKQRHWYMHIPNSLGLLYSATPEALLTAILDHMSAERKAVAP